MSPDQTEWMKDGTCLESLPEEGSEIVLLTPLRDQQLMCSVPISKSLI